MPDRVTPRWQRDVGRQSGRRRVTGVARVNPITPERPATRSPSGSRSRSRSARQEWASGSGSVLAKAWESASGWGWAGWSVPAGSRMGSGVRGAWLREWVPCRRRLAGGGRAYGWDGRRRGSDRRRECDDGDVESEPSPTRRGRARAAGQRCDPLPRSGGRAAGRHALNSVRPTAPRRPRRPRRLPRSRAQPG